MGTNQNLRAMINISKTKKDYLNEMLLITKEQQRVIEQNEMDQLNKLIDEKQSRIDAINSIDEQFQDNFSKLKKEFNINDIGDLIGTVCDEEMRELKKEISEIMAVIEDIKKVEKENSLKLSGQKKEIAQKLQEIKRNRLAANKYFNTKFSVPPNPAFFDKKK